MSKRIYSLEEPVEKVMLDFDSNSESEIDEAKVEKQLQKERKKEINKKSPEKSISSGFGRDDGLSVPGFGREVEPSCFGFEFVVPLFQIEKVCQICHDLLTYL